MTELRNPHIESIRRTMKDMGRPIKTDIIRDKDDNRVFYKIDKQGRLEIKDVVKIKE